MTTYNTGNPLGSAAAKDLYDNAQNLDHLSLDKENEYFPDRLGNPRITWHGMEEQFKRSLADVGWILVESFQIGASITLINQALKDESSGEYYRWDGALPKSVPAGSTPASTGGIGKGAWVAVGASAFGKSIAIVESVKDLMALSDKSANNVRQVTGYVPGTDFGGGQFYWDASKPKLQHNGITIFSPTVPWDGSYAGLASFLAGTGESNPSGNGCWVRNISVFDAIHTVWAGHDVTGIQSSNTSVESAIRLASALNRGCRVSAGILKPTFDKSIAYKDKYLVTRQTAFFLESLNVNIFADNDVEIDITSSTSSERTIFGLKSCNGEVSGINWNSDFVDYSISSTDTTFKPQEDWMGFVLEGCSVTIRNHNVNAPRMFINSDALNGIANKYVSVKNNNYKYNVNYCVITRNCDYSEFINNETWYSGRSWHTYGEDYAVSEGSRRSYAHGNRFYKPISIQSRITPAGENVTITDNYYEGDGIFIEIFAANNVICKGNTSKIGVGINGRASSHYLLITNEIGGDWGVNEGLSNIIITDNIMIGGGISVQGYNEGTQLKRGLIVTNNIMQDTKAPRLTASSWISPLFEGNTCSFANGFGDVGIGGQHPRVMNNILDGGYISLSPGYTVLSPIFESNQFRNTNNYPMDTVFSMNNFSGGIFRNNDIKASSFTKWFPSEPSVDKVGFRFVDSGFSTAPSNIYGSKCVISPGDWVVSDGTVTYGNPVAWVGSTSNTFLQINSAT